MKVFPAVAAVLLLLSCARPAATETASDAGDGFSPAGSGYAIRTAEPEDRGSLIRALKLRDLELAETRGTAVRYDRSADRAEVRERTLADAAEGDCPDLVIGGFAETLAPLYAAGAIKPLPGGCGDLGEETLAAEEGAFFITTPLVPSAFCDVSCILMSCAAAERYGVSGVVDAVRSGEWRWDTLAAAASVIPSGSGAYRFAVADPFLGPSAVITSARTVTDGDGTAVKPSLDEGADAPLGRARAVLSGPGAAFVPENGAGEGAGAAINLFSEGKALFLFCKTGDVPALRGAGCEFGIFPYPGSPGRGGYAGGADSVRGAAAAIPAGADENAARTVLPELCRLSGKYLLPEAADAMLSGPSSYDSGSARILSELFAGARYEAALAFAGEDGAALGDMLTDEATGRGTADGWEETAARVNRRREAAFCPGRRVFFRAGGNILSRINNSGGSRDE